MNGDFWILSIRSFDRESCCVHRPFEFSIVVDLEVDVDISMSRIMTPGQKQFCHYFAQKREKKVE
jgi:hypothetical protein